MKKKKILLLADDFRLPSGIGTISKEIILNTVHKYDWVQIGAAVKHPDTGKMFDVSKDVQKETGVKDADVKIIPSDGYGNRNLLFAVIEKINGWDLKDNQKKKEIFKYFIEDIENDEYFIDYFDKYCDFLTKNSFNNLTKDIISQ